MKFPIKLKGFGFKGRGGSDDDDDDDEEYEDDGGYEEGEESDEPHEAPPEGDEDHEALPEGDEDEDEEYEDYDEDEDEEGRPGRLSALLGDGRRRLIVIGAGGLAVFLVVAGVVGWLVIGGDGEQPVAGGKDGDPARPALKSKRQPGVSFVEIDIAPARRASTEGSLNAFASAVEGPGAGVAVPWVTLAAFETVPLAPASAPLSEVPDLALIEQGAQGPLPKVGDDGRQPWQVYARPFDADDSRPRIAIIVTGLGLSRAATDAAIGRLPGAVTLAFDPYAEGLGDWVRQARQAGHEILVSLPMESAEFPVNDPGPQALMTTLQPVENLSRLEYVLSRLSGYVGVATVMGSRFSTAEKQLRPILEALKKRGLMLVDGGSEAKTLAPRVATEIGLPRAMSNMVLDAEPSRTAIDRRLAELEALARKHAFMVATATPYPVTVERLAAWTATLEGKNLALAPVSAIADKQFLE